METGTLLQRPGVPGTVVFDSSGVAVLAISAFSELILRSGHQTISTAEVLAPAPPGHSWPAIGRVEHDGLGWTTWTHRNPDGSTAGSGDGGSGRGREWGLWPGATVTSGSETFTLDDLVRPESAAERTRREKRRFNRSEKMAGRALGHRFSTSSGDECGQLRWIGDHQPDHHDRPYEWEFQWWSTPERATLVGATATALRNMSWVGTMLSMS